MAVIISLLLFLTACEMRIGKRFSSPSLVADGRQFRADVLTESVVFSALAGHNRQKSLFDF